MRAVLDAALLALLQNAPLPPTPPSIDVAEVRPYLSPEAEAAERRLKRNVAAFTLRSETFRNETRELILAVEQSIQHWDRADVMRLRDLISDTETMAEQRAVESARTEKNELRRRKRLFELSPSAGALHRTYIDQLFAIERQNIEEMLAFSLSLRALVAGSDPDARGGPEFTNADDLSKYLETAIA